MRHFGLRQEDTNTLGFLTLHVSLLKPNAAADDEVMKLLSTFAIIATAWSSNQTCEEAEADDSAGLTTQLLQVSHVLQRGPVGTVPYFWNLQSILSDNPPGTFLMHMSALVQAVGLTYNTSRPLASRVEGSWSAGVSKWDRLYEFDTDPSPGGVFARVFVDRANKAGIIAFKGICTDPHIEQCQIDQCYLVKIQNYGMLSADVAELSGFMPESCDRHQQYLNYAAQANQVVQQVQRALPKYSLLLTGHSLGGMLAIVTAAQQPNRLKALTFAPTPFNVVLTQELHFSEEQIKALQVNDLVATCDPYDCGINAIYAHRARLGAETCLYLYMQEPSPCQGLAVPYTSPTWREHVGAGSNVTAAIPDLLCKGSAHRWQRYESAILQSNSRGQPVNLPVCSTDFSVLETALRKAG